MTNMRNSLMVAQILLALACLQPASAAIVNVSLGNTMAGFADGSTPDTADVGAAQGGQPAPFNQSYGTDIGLFEPPASFAQTWTHSYGAIVDPIIAASITIGIYDHDSAASGSQLALFDIDGNDLTPDLDILFENPGQGADNMYNEYTVNLGAGLFSDLADGSALVSMALMGPGQVPELFGTGISETMTNGANLIFSTLTIETRDPSVVPIPAAAPLFASALLLMGFIRRRLRHDAV